VTGLLTIRKKELQGKDNLTIKISHNDKAFNVTFRLSIKLKVHTCSLTFTQDKPFNLEHNTF